MCQQHNQRSTAVAEKRQADTRVRNCICYNCNVQNHLDAHLHGQANSQQHTEFVLCPQGNHNSPPNEHRKQNDNQQRTDKAEFLTDNGKDEVILWLRQIQIFLPALAQTQPKQPPGTDRIQGLLRLPCVI